jgi:hypothetical protein
MSRYPLNAETTARAARMLRTAFGPGIAARLEEPTFVEVILIRGVLPAAETACTPERSRMALR